MITHTVGIVMNGVTGRMGTNQHLMRSIHAIRQQGGVRIASDTVIMPQPILVGRDKNKLERLARDIGGASYTTDLDAALSDKACSVYFDAQTTDRRVASVKKAIAAGKHVYCEKPTAETLAGAMELFRLADAASVKHGVVQDKLWLPGLLQLKYLLDTGFFGRILSVRGEFGYWVFSGEFDALQRPSWNYRKQDGGGIILDMLCHWRYVIDNLFGNVTSVSCLGATHVGRRWDERHAPYEATADDAAYAVFTTDRGVVCQFNSSWCTRVNRDELLELHVDGEQGSAVAGLRHCKIQHAAATPRAVWNPDMDDPIAYRAAWTPMPMKQPFENAFKAQWELFLRHVVLDEPFRWNLREAAKGVQLAELGMQSWSERRTLDVPQL